MLNLKVVTRMLDTLPGRAILTAFVMCMWLLPMSASARAKPGDSQVVYPTGDFPTDTMNVQAAADNGGAILLKATNQAGVPTAFNFGPPDDTNTNGGVFLTRNVQILGEQIDGHQTTIDGGVVPFRGYGPGISPSTLIRISNIDFEHPLLSAVIITETAGATIDDNRVSDVQGAVGYICYDPPACSVRFYFTEGRAIKFLGNNDPDNAITGQVIVSHNVILGSHADLSAPIVFDEVAADVSIDANRVETTQEAGILMYNASGRVMIFRNIISPGPGDTSPFSTGNGITLVDFESRGAKYNVVDNTLDIMNPNADGIVLAGFGNIAGAVIEGNQITMHGTYYGAITMVDNVSNSLIANNRIDGGASFGMDVLQFDPASYAGANTFSGNNLATFDAAVADLYLDGNTSETVVVGHTDTVVDLGYDNLVTGVTPMGGASVGRQIAQAEAVKRHPAMHMISVKPPL